MAKKLTSPLNVALLGKSDRSSQSADFLTAADWAIKLQVSKRTIFRMIDEKTIPAYDLTVGKVRRWHFSTYERWVADRVGGN
jgi:excisionase family DNA binding protein